MKNSELRFNHDDLSVRCVASMLGCKPSHGLANTLNDLDARGAIPPPESATVGDLLIAFLESELQRARERRANR